MSKTLAALYREADISALLSKPDANPKVAKNGKLGVAASVLHLAAGDMSGHEVCPKRSPGCTAACLMTAGNPAYLKNKTQSRIKKTKLLFSNRDLFMNILALEMLKAVEAAKKANMEPAFRLNGTSDIVWEKKTFKILDWVADKFGREDVGYVTILELFPKVQFYDYTKIAGRKPPKNYHLTFSESEINAADVAKEMARGYNIASVFPYGKVPKTHLGRVVISGDEHDYRPVDARGVVVGLGAKGLARNETSGFVNV